MILKPTKSRTKASRTPAGAIKNRPHSAAFAERSGIHYFDAEAESLPRHLVEAYDSKLVGTLDCIQQALDECNYEAVCHIAHRLAGSSGMYGRHRLSLIARVMLHASRSRSLAALSACLLGARQLANEARGSVPDDCATQPAAG